MINHYHYTGELRAYMLQFAAIFHALQVETGKGECDEVQRISVPLVIGNKDRVVAAINAGNTKNKMFSLPTMAFNMSGLEPAPERRKVQAYVHQQVTMKQGGVFPDDLTVVKRAMPVPYNMTIEMSIWASNTQQMHQILEQILVLFNPDIQIQKSDGNFDWTKLTNVELTDISNEENYPSSTSVRAIVWSLNFRMPIYLSLPMGVKDDLVRRIVVQIGLADQAGLNEVGPDGEIQPFGTPVAILDYDTRSSPPRDPNVDQFIPPPTGPESFLPKKLS